MLALSKIYKMMNKPILLIPYSLDEFTGIIHSSVEEALKRFNPQPPQTEQFLTRKETAYKLKISLVTLNDWTKRGMIQSYIIGGRVLYKESEIEKSLHQVRTVKY